jgi:hypothetical protein
MFAWNHKSHVLGALNFASRSVGMTDLNPEGYKFLMENRTYFSLSDHLNTIIFAAAFTRYRGGSYLLIGVQ